MLLSKYYTDIRSRQAVSITQKQFIKADLDSALKPASVLQISQLINVNG